MTNREFVRQCTRMMEAQQYIMEYVDDGGVEEFTKLERLSYNLLLTHIQQHMNLVVDDQPQTEENSNPFKHDDDDTFY